MSEYQLLNRSFDYNQLTDLSGATFSSVRLCSLKLLPRCSLRLFGLGDDDDDWSLLDDASEPRLCDGLRRMRILMSSRNERAFCSIEAERRPVSSENKTSRVCLFSGFVEIEQYTTRTTMNHFRGVPPVQIVEKVKSARALHTSKNY